MRAPPSRASGGCQARGSGTRTMVLDRGRSLARQNSTPAKSRFSRSELPPQRAAHGDGVKLRGSGTKDAKGLAEGPWPQQTLHRQLVALVGASYRRSGRRAEMGL
jgi:hypothetical protein